MSYPSGPFAHGLMLHHFCGGVHPRGQGAITAQEFDAILDFIGPRRLLSADEWQARSLAGRLDPDDVCVTFDDALRCQVDIAGPVLASRNLTAFWFVYSSVFEGVQERLEVYRYLRTVSFDDIDSYYDAFDREIARSPHAGLVAQSLTDFDPDRYLSEYAFYSRRDRIFRYLRDRVLGQDRYFEIMDAMVDSLGIDKAGLSNLLWMNDADLQRLDSKGHVIGLHSYSHPTLMAGQPLAIQAQEYGLNRDHLLRVLGKAPTTVAHPCNSYGPETLDLLQSLGIRLGFRANMLQGPGGSLERPRADHADILAMMA